MGSSRVIGLPAQIKNKRDEAQQPPNNSTSQQSKVGRTAHDISVAGGNQDAGQLAHALIIVNAAYAVSTEQLSLAHQLRQLRHVGRDPPTPHLA